jgi:hypothetical protein
MRWQVTRVLIGLIFAFVMALPASASSMAMPSDEIGQASDPPCQHRPHPGQTGDTNPDKMPACQAPVCISAPAVLRARCFCRDVSSSGRNMQAP